MIEFKISDQAILMGENTSSRFEFISPIFRLEEVITSPYTLSFNVPDDESGINRKLFGFYDSLTNRLDVHEFETDVYLLQNYWMTGILSVSYTEGSFECNFVQLFNLANDLSNQLNTIDLDEFDYNYPGGAQDFYDDFRERCEDSYAGEKDYVLYPVYNPNLFNNEDDIVWNLSGNNNLIANYLKYVNYWYCACFVPFAEYYLYDNNPIMEYAMSPSIYIKYIIEKLFGQYSFTINSGDFLDLDDIQKLTMFSNKVFLMNVAWTSTPSYVFTPTPILPQSAVFDLSTFFSDITIQQFLLGIKKTFCLVYLFSLNRKQVEIVPVKDILALDSQENWTNKVLINYTKEKNDKDGFSLEYNYGDDDLFTERIKQLASKNILDVAIDYASLPSAYDQDMGDVCLVIDENVYYEVIINAGSKTWQYYSDNLLNYSIGNTKKSINIQSETLLQDLEQTDLIEAFFKGYLPGYVWNIPEMNEPTDSEIMGIQKREQTLRMLFYRGMQEYLVYSGEPCGEEPACEYPYATRSEKAADGSVIGDYSLQFDGDYGLYLKWWKPLLDLLANASYVNYKMDLGVNDLLNLDFKKKINITDPTSGGTRKYMIKKISVRINRHNIEPAKVELISVD